MARPRVRRMTRNPNKKTSLKTKNKWNISFSGVHPLVKELWDKKKTLKENYSTLGLVSHLAGHAGGVGGEGLLVVEELARIEDLKNNVQWASITPEEKGGSSNGVIYAPLERDTPLDERVLRIGVKMNAKQVHPDVPQETELVKEMKKEALQIKKFPRHQSEQETIFFEALMQKYGENWEGMQGDRKMNPYQLSAGQLKKKFARYLKDAQ